MNKDWLVNKTIKPQVKRRKQRRKKKNGQSRTTEKPENKSQKGNKYITF